MLPFPLREQIFGGHVITHQIQEVRNMSEDEKAAAVSNVAMDSPERLKRWLQASNRQWLVLNTTDLVDALPWPGGVETLMEILNVYREHRLTIPVTEEMARGLTVERGKREQLEVAEIDRAIRYLVGLITDELPEWHLGNDPL